MGFLKSLNISRYQLDILLIISLCPLYNAFVGSYGVFQLLTLPLLFFFAYYKHLEKNKFPIKDYVWIYILMLIQDALLTMALGEKDVIQELKVHIVVLLVILHPISFKTAKIIYPLMGIVGVMVGAYMLQHRDMVDNVRLSLQVGDVMQDPNWIAIFLYAPFCLGLSLVQKNNLINKLLGGCAIIFSVYVVFLTGSRGALYGLVAALLIWLKMLFKKTRVLNFIIVIASVILLVILFITYFLPNVELGLIERYTNSSIVENERRRIWRDLIYEYINGGFLEMIVGRGPMSCVKILGYSGHNIFLEYLFQFGIVGFSLLISFFTKVVKYTFQSKNLIGLYLLTALITLSLTTPIWGHIYFMLPISAVLYVNNAIFLSDKLKYNSKK